MGIGSANTGCARNKKDAHASQKPPHAADPRRMDRRPAVQLADPPLTGNGTLRGSGSHINAKKSK